MSIANTHFKGCIRVSATCTASLQAARLRLELRDEVVDRPIVRLFSIPNHRNVSILWDLERDTVRGGIS